MGNNTILRSLFRPVAMGIAQQVARQATEWCDGKVQKDFGRAIKLTPFNQNVRAGDFLPIADMFAVNKDLVGLRPKAEIALPSISQFGTWCVAQGSGFQDPNMPVLLGAHDGSMIYYVPPSLVGDKEVTCSTFARVAAIQKYGFRDFVERTIYEMILNKGEHRGTPYQTELDKRGRQIFDMLYTTDLS